MANTPDLVLWGVGTSRTVRAHWALAELGLAYETRAIGPRTGETKTAEYTRLNPRQKVPLLQDGSRPTSSARTLSDQAAISFTRRLASSSGRPVRAMASR